MKNQQSRIFQYFLIFGLALLLLRLFPVVIRLGQAIFMGLRAFWWIAVPALVIGWITWKLKRLNLKETEPMRDVTHSVIDKDKP